MSPYRSFSTKISPLVNVIIMGPPGGGKGTISKKLVADFAYHHISTGDLLRENVSRRSELGIAVKDILERGGLVPDKLIVDMISAETQSSKSYLLDGFPRTVEQAMLIGDKVKIDAVLALDIPHDVIIQRVANRWIHAPSGRTYSYDYNPPKILGVDDITGEKLTKRADDNVDVMKQRLDTYSKMTAPLLHFYEEKKLLKSFQGTESDVIYPMVKSYLRDAAFVSLKH
eukprot:gene3214-6352_t